MFKSGKTSTLLAFAAVALIAAVVGLWLADATRNQAVPILDQAQLRDGPFLRLPEPKPIADFALYDHEGNPYARTSLQGSWTLAFFGFTSCPHICPDTLFKLTEVVDRLEGELPAARVPQVLLIGVDPERDTPEALARYCERFGNEILAVSGPHAQLRALAMQLGAHYVVPEHDPDQWYNVDHSLRVMLLDPQARWVGVFSAPHDTDAMAGALQRFLSGRFTANAGG